MPIIELRGVSYIYGEGTPIAKTALEDVSVSIDKEEIVGVIGQTGSGKSTLMQHLNGLLKPTTGKVLLDGKDIWSGARKIRNVRFKVGMVFQYPEHQLFEDTVFKDIAFGPKNMGLSQDEIINRIKKAIQFVDLDVSLLNKSPFELSGGEKRRAAIAGVIAMDPDVIIFDEPTAGLDPVGRENLLSQIESYHKAKKNTIILVSHSMEDIARLTDKVIVMNDGRVAMFDKTRKVFSREHELEKMGLRTPQITKIMAELRNRGYDISSGVLRVEQGLDEILKLLGKRVK